MLNEGTELTEVLQHLEMAESIGSLRRKPARRDEGQWCEAAQRLEGENAHPEKLPAETELDTAMLKELAEQEW